jgi:hypothetical protein
MEDPLFQLSPDNRGPLIVVAVYTSVVTTGIILGIRFIWAYRFRLAFGFDDALFLAASVSKESSLRITPCRL